MTGIAEHEVVRRARMGDRRAFESLYSAHFARIHATVSARTRNRDDVDDLVQVAFIRAFEGMRTFRGEAALSTWLTRIALNVCNSHHQSESARRRALKALASSTSGGLRGWGGSECEIPDAVLSRKETRDRVARWISGLPSRCRSAMWLRYVEDRSYAEIQAELGVPSGTIKTWLWRGRTLLRDGVHGDAGEGDNLN